MMKNKNNLKLLFLKWLLLPLGLILSIFPLYPVDNAAPGSDTAERLKTFMEELVREDRFSGSVLLAKNGRILFKGAYGLASKRFNVPNRIDTKFNLGSMNKMFTAVAVAQLVEKGKLSYDDLVGKYLDSSWISRKTAEKVKIKHLLSHSSGLGSYFHNKFQVSSRLMFRKLEDYKPLVKDDTPGFEPGSAFRYSNTGMFLLGAVIGKVSGQNYFDYIREHIYKPAGMLNSDCYEMDRPVPNLAIGYHKSRTSGGTEWQNNIYHHVVKGGPAGGGFSTVEDLFRFAQALKKNKLMSKESFKLLTTIKREFGSTDYGYGFIVLEEGGDVITGHTGGFAGISSVLRIYKKSGYVYAVLSNYSGAMFAVDRKLCTLLKNR